MAYSIENKTSPYLSKSAFWDVDLCALDFNLFSEFVIIRVFERGTERDVHETIRYFGQSKIIKSLQQATSLQPRALAVAEKLFNLSLN